MSAKVFTCKHNRRIPGTSRSLSQLFQKVAGVHDLDTANRCQGQEMPTVTRDEEIRSARHGAFQKHLVVGIGSDPAYLDRGEDEFRCCCQSLGLANRLTPGIAGRQTFGHLRIFSQYRRADERLAFASRPRSEAFKRRATPETCADHDIGIENYALHGPVGRRRRSRRTSTTMPATSARSRGAAIAEWRG